MIVLVGVWQLSAMELSFTSLRLEEKTLALNAFKKLYKERRNIHKSMRQVLKHARAKSLQKNRLSFFQPKAIESLSYNEEHLFETNGALVELQTPCPKGCIAPSPPDDSIYSGSDTTETESNMPPSNDSHDNITLESSKESGIRPTTVSPWALR